MPATQNDLLQCHALWIGSTLPLMQAACLASFQRAGHAVVLHTYEGQVSGVPPGIEIRDASRILPVSKIIRHYNSQSTALFSDYFRLKVLEQGLGLYVDADVYCLRPVRLQTPYIMGYEDQNFINGAVLALPFDSPVISELLSLFKQKWRFPPWLQLSWRARCRLLLQSCYRRQPLVCFLRWGTAGPKGLTYLVAKHGLDASVQPQEVFYPVHYNQALELLKADFDICRYIKPQTLCVHLWNEKLKHVDKAPEPESFIGRIIEEMHGGRPALNLS